MMKLTDHARRIFPDVRDKKKGVYSLMDVMDQCSLIRNLLAETKEDVTIYCSKIIAQDTETLLRCFSEHTNLFSETSSNKVLIILLGSAEGSLPEILQTLPLKGSAKVEYRSDKNMPSNLDHII